MDAEVRARVGPQLRPELLQGRRRGAVLGHGRGGHDGTVQPVPGGADAETPVSLANLVRHRSQLVRRRRHLHLSEKPFGLCGLAGKPDAQQPAYQAAAAVAADQPARAQPCAVGQFDRDSVVVLLDACHLVAAADLSAELDGTLGQQAVGDRLRDAEDVTVRGVQGRRRRLVDPGEAAGAAGILLAVREEPVQQTALVHDLDAARMQAQRADQLARLRILLQHQHVHVVQPQLAGQHHPGRAAAADDHLGHETPDSANTYSGGQSQIARSRKAARRLRD